MLLVSPIWLIPQPAKAQIIFEPIKQEVNVQPNKPQTEYRPEVIPLPGDIPRKFSANKKKVVKPIPANQETETSGRDYSKEEVTKLINDYSQLYGISPETPLCIARLESGFNQHSKNKSSSASGVFQYLSGTWKATDEGKAGQSVMDAESNIKAAIKYMASRKNAIPWTTAKSCPPISVAK